MYLCNVVVVFSQCKPTCSVLAVSLSLCPYHCSAFYYCQHCHYDAYDVNMIKRCNCKPGAFHTSIEYL